MNELSFDRKLITVEGFDKPVRIDLFQEYYPYPWEGTTRKISRGGKPQLWRCARLQHQRLCFLLLSIVPRRKSLRRNNRAGPGGHQREYDFRQIPIHVSARAVLSRNRNIPGGSKGTHSDYGRDLHPL
jgi:hypothetical protein